MLEDFIPGAAVQLRAAPPLGVHLDALCASLFKQGYRSQTIREKVRTIARLSRWMAAKRLGVIDLDERCVEQFSNTQRRRGARHTLLQLIDHLRTVGALPLAAHTSDDSHRAALLAGYAEYLSRERGLAGSTIKYYLEFVDAFIAEQLKGGAVPPAALCVSGIREFMLNQARIVVSKRTQLVGTALRSFLKFLFLRGEISSDLALAVPIVRRATLVDVPRHMSPENVEQLLNNCKRSSTTGRRDYAVLLLLARLGLRASEVIALELGDVRWREAEIIVRGKGMAHDRLPLLPDVGQAIAVYLQKDRPSVSCRHVFLCRRAPHRGLSHPSTVSTIVMRALARAGLTPASRGAHLLRHSLATAMVRQGASFAEIGQVLRHRSPNTTEIYAKLDFAALRDISLPWPVIGGGQ